jgi:hypothetical protein
MKTRCILCLLGCACALAACSSRELYNSAASVRQQECNKMMDRDERERCMRTATRTYDEYEQSKKR